MADVSTGSEIMQITRLTVRFVSDGLEQIRREQGRSSTEVWRRIQQLGQGAFATVHLERYDAPSGHQLRAVKQLQKDVGSGKIDYRRELEAAALFSHGKYQDSFVQSFGWYETADLVFLTMEYLQLGDLNQQMRRRFQEAEAHTIIHQILIALEYMHERDFIHRDLKPANILICRLGPDWWIKFADFGISKRALDSDTTLRTQIGTPRYGAPEVWMGGKPYTRAVDIWSAGIITYSLLTTKVSPFNDLGSYYYRAEEVPSQHVIQDGVGEVATGFIARLLSSAPESRPGATECLNLEWMTAANAINTQRSSKEVETNVLPYPDTRNAPPDPQEYVAQWTTIKGEESHKTTSMSQFLVDVVARLTTADDAQTKSAMFTHHEEFSPTVRDHQARPMVTTDGALAGASLGAWLADLRQTETTESSSMRIAASSMKDGAGPPPSDPLTSEWPETASPPTQAIHMSGGNDNSGYFLQQAQVTRRMKSWKVLAGHDGRVTFVAFSPDGRLLATASRDGTVRLWDTATDTSLKVIRHGDGRLIQKPEVNPVTCVAFAPDGTTLASGASDKTVRIWGSATGAEVACLTGHKHWVRCIAFSPDGKWLASSAYDSSIRLWHPNTGVMQKRLNGLNDKISSLAFSSDSRKLASSSFAGTVQLWDLVDKPYENTLREYPSPEVESVAFSPVDSTLLALGLHDGAVQLLDTATGETRQTLRCKSKVWSVAFSPDGTRIASGSQTVQVCSVETGTLLQTLDGHRADVRCVAWSPNGEVLASASDYRTVRLWDCF